MKKPIQWIILALFLVVGSVVYSLFGSSSGMRVQTADVSQGTVRTWVEDQAMTTLPLVHRITLPQDGRILPIVLEPGHAVSKGQAVAQMDSTDFMAALAISRAQVAEIEAQIAVNEYNRIEKTALKESSHVIEAMREAARAADEWIRANEAELEYSKWVLDMEKELVRQKASSMEKLRRVERDVGQADSSLASSRFMSKAVWAVTAAFELLPRYIEDYLGLKDLQTDALHHRLDGARAQLEQAVRQLERTSIKSPVDGVVLRRLVENEQFLPAGTLLMEIGDMNDLEVTADILSQDAVMVRPGHPVDIYGPAIGEAPIQGKVLHIRPAGFTRVSSLGVEQQRVPIIVGFDAYSRQTLAERGRSLGLAYRVRVRIYTGEEPDVLKIPRTGLFRGTGNQWQVFAVEEGRAVLRSVELGLQNDNEAQIIKGLTVGETIIVAPPKGLREGDRVIQGPR